MNISASVENNPALILLQSTVQALTLSTPVVQPQRDSVDISDTAKQLAQHAANTHS